jgi:hypothetical protein
MGDHMQITTDRHVESEREGPAHPSDSKRDADGRLFAVWTDLRNQVINAQGVLQHQNDIFLQSDVPQLSRPD